MSFITYAGIMMANDPMILLTAPPLRHRTFNGANKALPVLASALRNAGFARVKQLDMERPDVKIENICKAAEGADLVAFAGVQSPQLPELDSASMELRSHLKQKGLNVPIIAGGYVSKGIGDVIAEMPQITAFFNGEGEEGIVRIARSVSRGRLENELGSIQGLCFVDRQGAFHFSRAERVQNFDAIDQDFGFTHVPDKHDMDIFVRNGRQLKTVELFTQRGCAYSCSFCNKSAEQRGIVRLDLERFKEHLARARADGFEAAYIDVDTFTINPELARKEALALKEAGFVWGTNTRIDMLSEADASFFSKNGCVYLFAGVEHSKPEVILAQRKFNGKEGCQIRESFLYPDKVRAFFRSLGLAGMPSSYFMILGLPKAVVGSGGARISGYAHSTLEDDLEAIRFALSCGPDYLNFNGLRFMPGSEAADVPGHPAYSQVRPSGVRPISAGWFLPRVAKKLGYHAQENHGIYRLLESAGSNQPMSTILTPDRVDRCMEYAMEGINQRIDSGMKPTRLFIDRQVLDEGLVSMDKKGRYRKAPLKEFEGLEVRIAAPDRL